MVAPVALMISFRSTSARRAISGAGASISAATISPRPRAETTFGSSRTRSSSDLAVLAHTREERLVVDHVQRRVGRGAHHRAAGERRAVVARREHLLQTRSDDQRTDRKAAAQALGQRHRVRHDAQLLVRPQRAGPAHARLDLVEHQRRAHRVARLADALQQLGRHHVHAGLALDRLDQHGGRVGVDRRRHVSRIDRAEARHQRRERRLLGLLRRRAKARRRSGRGTRSSATTTSPRGRCLRTSLIAASFASAPELQKNTDEPNEREHSRAAKRHVRLVVEQVRDVHQPPDLLLHGRDDLRVAMAEVVDRDPAQEVEVLVPAGVDQQQPEPDTNSTG